MSNEEREVKRLRIRGTVHGVGYRVWVEREALALGLKGWVRNRRDGSVEVIAGGPPAAVAQLIERCRSGPPLAKVDAIDLPRHRINGEDRAAKLGRGPQRAGSIHHNAVRRDIGANVDRAFQRLDRKSTRLNSSHRSLSRMPSSA